MTDLLPCPFCGGRPEHKEAKETGGTYICCSYCNSSTAVYYDRPENLLASWNTRTPTQTEDE